MTLDVTAKPVRGRWVKHTYPGSPPLPERDPPPDNRWQRGDVVDALYLADDTQTAWAEWYRHLAERMIPPLAQMPREIWTWQVEPPTPGRHNWNAYQTVGEQLRHEGWTGLLAPSAARPAGQILCLFRDHEHSIEGAEPVPPPRRVEEPPPPPTGLVT